MFEGPRQPCDFWTRWRKHREHCKHTQHALAVLRTTQPGFKEVLLQKLEDTLAIVPEYTARQLATRAKPGSKAVPLVQQTSVDVDLSRPWCKLAAAILSLGLCLDKSRVEESTHETGTLLSVYKGDNGAAAEADFFVLVEHQPNRRAAEAARQAKRPALRYGKPLHLVQITPGGLLLIDRALSEPVSKIQPYSQLEVFTY